ncbi:MAG: hypothetical protein QOJ80_7227 [Mycobacterium sp.]|jgi:hypothetical protein|nr:hypothetical protein [Mycobacterium sp.]
MPRTVRLLGNSLATTTAIPERPASRVPMHADADLPRNTPSAPLKSQQHSSSVITANFSRVIGADAQPRTDQRSARDRQRGVLLLLLCLDLLNVLIGQSPLRTTSDFGCFRAKATNRPELFETSGVPALRARAVKVGMTKARDAHAHCSPSAMSSCGDVLPDPVPSSRPMVGPFLAASQSEGRSRSASWCRSLPVPHSGLH